MSNRNIIDNIYYVSSGNNDEEIETINDQINMMEERINSVEGSIVENQIHIEDVNNMIHNLDIDNINEKINTIGTIYDIVKDMDIEEIHNRLDEIDIETINNNINKNSEDIITIINDVDNLNAKTSINQDNIREIEKDIRGIENDINKNTSDIETINNRIDNLDIGYNGSDINAEITARVNILEGQIEDLDANIDDRFEGLNTQVNKSISEINSAIDDLYHDDSMMDRRIYDIEDNIETINNIIGTMNTNINENKLKNITVDENDETITNISGTLNAERLNLNTVFTNYCTVENRLATRSNCYVHFAANEEEYEAFPNTFGCDIITNFKRKVQFKGPLEFIFTNTDSLNFVYDNFYVANSNDPSSSNYKRWKFNFNNGTFEEAANF